MSATLRSIGWIVGTVVGLAVGGFVFHFPGSFGEVSWQPTAVVFGVLLGAINGLFVGLCQWAGLGFPAGRVRRLMAAMAIGVGVSHGLADGSASWIGLTSVAVVGGVGVAAGHAWAFDARRPGLAIASVVGWAAGWLIGDWLTTLWRMPWTETPVGWSQEHLVVGVVVGLTWGIATALVGLPAWIVGRRPSASVDLDGSAAAVSGGLG